MIQAVEKIPVVIKPERPTRTSTVKSDIRAALEDHISRFEFVGEIYKKSERFTTSLSKGMVSDLAWGIIRNYLYKQLVATGYSPDYPRAHYELYRVMEIGDTYKVYRLPDGDNDRIFMEIDFDRIDYMVKQYKDKCESMKKRGGINA